MSIWTALAGGPKSSGAVGKSRRPSAFEAARLAYALFFTRFHSIVRLLLLPMTAAGLVLYLTLSAYLSELLEFLATGDPRVASLALGSLAAGIFLSLFCYASAVFRISRLSLGREPESIWFPFGSDRQEWRLYAAYLRFLLLVTLVIVTAYGFGAYVAPLLRIPGEIAALALTAMAGAVIFWLVARVGLLIAPVIASSEGPVLRRAFTESAADLWRNSALILLLLIPGLAVQSAGEYLLRLLAGASRPTGEFPLSDDVELVGSLLGSFLVVVSLSALVTIALLTLGGMAAYGNGRLAEPAKGQGGRAQNPSLTPAAPAGGPPE